ncbi:UDP-glucose:glycoprotein glucosyltransferase-domain-containing protein [Macrophomina phaseolina]|uniref:UDP-glucose:glycoprotein glucosyltransferase-domain-containing protein n=1 Tax=Macrophomina phaseolina TaxID=35725 RepID=A0ABQ8GTX2_9PEZI|nr:UDP-glucose:glycoprotein glucosyltransferase-domain-containing protein [Macrophomina phaseolina]
MRVGQWLLSSQTALLLAALSPHSVTASPPINVALQARFNSPPYLVELLETAADENSTAYFPLLDRIANGYFDSQSTEKELYESFLKLLQDDGHITDPDALSSFQLALSIHTAAPRIEAHYQFYNTSVEPSLEAEQGEECDSWVLLDGKQYCSPELDKEHGLVKDARTADLPFDRPLSLERRSVASILYADITSPSFRKLHKTVIKTAEAGASSYKLRHKPPKNFRYEPQAVHGYGVELALKRTDYIVIDDRQAEEAADKPASDAAQTILQDQEVTDLKPLSESELKGLGLKAGSFVMGSEDPLDTLLKLSQDFPKHSSAIAAHEVSEEFLKEHKENRAAILPPGYNILWINGVQVMPRDVDAFALLEHLRRERQIINGVRKLGFAPPEAIGVLSNNAIAKAKDNDEPQRYDWRDAIEGGNVIMFLNNLEKDKRYAEWPESLRALLQPTYPGTLPSVKRDIQNVIIPLDLTHPLDTTLLVETLQNMVKRKLALRWGLVPSTKNIRAERQAHVVYYLQEYYGLGAVLQYLEHSLKLKEITEPSKTAFYTVTEGAKIRGNRVAKTFEEIFEEKSVVDRVKGASDWLRRLAADGNSPPFFVNGVALRRNDEWLSTMSMRVSQDLSMIQKGVFEEQFDQDGDDWLPEVFLANSTLRRNPLVIPEDEKDIKHLNLAQIYAEHGDLIERLPRFNAADDSEWFQWAQLIVLGDFDSNAGANLLADAYQFSSNHGDLETIFIHTGDVDHRSRMAYLLYKNAGKTEMEDLPEDFEPTAQEIKEVEEFWSSMKPLIRALDGDAGRESLVLNGRTIGPLRKRRPLTEDDLENLLKYERKKRIEPAARAIIDLGLEKKIQSPASLAQFTSLVALSTVSDIPEGIFDSPPTTRRDVFKFWNDTHTCIKTGDIDKATIQIVASVDPSSEAAQRWLPIFKVLSELSGVHMRLFLNPKERLDELPVKRFYRYVLDSKPSFDEDGSTKTLQAKFEGIPSEALLNLGLDVPPQWVVAAKESIHDLDNIKLSQLKGQSSIDAIYELEYILIEGHSRDMTTGMYPRGAQLDLRTASNPRYADTIIMANLGYFQFKANPGFFSIELQPGRSQEIFRIDSAGTLGWSPQPGDRTQEIALMDFKGVTLYPRLSRRAGKEDEDVLEAPSSMVENLAAKGAALADGILSKVGLKGVKTGGMIQKTLRSVGLSTDLKAASSPHADINIFSVASGHLYERMLNIMMVSVMKHTKHTVKFWFIEQFLSPSFKSFLPTLAAAYNFDYEMVTYKWPHWLRGQKEKQREIWGYKILFLDVLFPLDLDKVIFVDADQVVRTDMYDLVTLDLGGAPYGFTPMCDSRTEMEGFRFWKQGYWKNFLKGRPYHISALYVVDLNAFRRLAAGDRLRQQYQQLSADPNSLSNLDQDLPNNMQAVLPIHSLPQEWLWCETWCSDESLKDARTIDLCNNPQTKEPKLERARRQVPEWTVYDEEIAALARKARAQGEAGAAAGVVVDEEDRELLEKVERQAQEVEREREEEKKKEGKTHDEL